ncbi:hypothetical protein [Aporhodopirellula aestuarii]|uniref:Uncharacterized protein n=1 Tax=Aporhodopirellula aestuarii TaxID=2950107 RepID=A0ABT0TYH8_9BACT|nr:hypothetical protein [Aporhodopirellula aestuarii]MCM2369536.1 hypothetical protein [Aporhodopirellula aestuarii]
MSRIVSPTSDAPIAVADIDLESIVRRVLRELGAMENKPAPAPAVGSVVIDQSVVAVADVEAIPAAVKHVELRPRAVVTPAARDELRHRGISITTQHSERSAAAGSESKPPVQPGTRAIDLQADGDVSESLLASVKKQITLRGVRLCNRASVSVILSSRPATTAHHACGTDRCVVSINRVDDVRRFLAELSPNVFVLDVKHLHVVAITGAISAIAKPSIQTKAGPKVTVAGGLS